ncbi:nucleoside recognition protein [Methanoculleus taiwanensis]|uniref:Nucleoside recognition protein n=1 Tax=Methanoculleus taiwanensis TaxID=1550565 RepID=A0A498H0Y2_9EURY|nr:nucleoside recognition protein [Methanoculleus taiwanensis]RXE56258.1 nucleoside recognition protein [Methanoculleus taiwanensis]
MYDSIVQTVTLAAGLLGEMVPMMVIGVFLAELLVALKVAGRIAAISRPLTAFACLREECGTSFLMAFVSPPAANAMLVDYHAKEIITRRELVIAAIMNSFPTVVMHWRYLLPVYIPLLGIPGLIYFGLLMLVGLAKTVVVMVAGRVILTPPPPAPLRSMEAPAAGTLRDALREAGASSWKTLTRLLKVTVPTIVIVAFLINAGTFDRLAEMLEGAGGFFPVPPEGFAIIAAQFGSFVAGASVASALLAAGDMTWQQIVLTLLVGNILTSVTRSIRWFGSSYAAIFGMRTGTAIMLISTALRNGIMVVLVVVLAYGLGWG